MKPSATLLSIVLAVAAVAPAAASTSANTDGARATANIVQAQPAANTTILVEGGAAAAPPQPRRICRKEQMPATNVPGRSICLTAEEWSRLETEEAGFSRTDFRRTRR